MRAVLVLPTRLPRYSGELKSNQSRFAHRNDWIGEEIVRFNPYSIRMPRVA